ncbi:MAG: CopG family antitoxin [Geminicoccaceae bacterium]
MRRRSTSSLPPISEYDFLGFKPMRFELEPKTVSVELDLPAFHLDVVTRRAKEQGISYECFIREALGQALAEH